MCLSLYDCMLRDPDPRRLTRSLNDQWRPDQTESSRKKHDDTDLSSSVASALISLYLHWLRVYTSPELRVLYITMLPKVFVLLASTSLCSAIDTLSQDDIIVHKFSGKKAATFGNKNVRRAAPVAAPNSTAVVKAAVVPPETNALANKANGAPNTKVDLLGRPLVPSLIVGGGGLGVGAGIGGGFSGGFAAGGFGGFGIGGIGGILGGGIGGIGTLSCQVCIGITCIGCINTGLSGLGGFGLAGFGGFSGGGFNTAGFGLGGLNTINGFGAGGLGLNSGFGGGFNGLGVGGAFSGISGLGLGGSLLGGGFGGIGIQSCQVCIGIACINCIRSGLNGLGGFGLGVCVISSMANDQGVGGLGALSSFGGGFVSGHGSIY
ncbi:hypothetical protein MRB53_039335 [Persea americana]|nr:hypothetical protein MRB53_039335 [Persea americana]